MPTVEPQTRSEKLAAMLHSQTRSSVPMVVTVFIIGMLVAASIFLALGLLGGRTVSQRSYNDLSAKYQSSQLKIAEQQAEIDRDNILLKSSLSGSPHSSSAGSNSGEKTLTPSKNSSSNTAVKNSSGSTKKIPSPPIVINNTPPTVITTPAPKTCTLGLLGLCVLS